MTDYTPIKDFAVKDNLAATDPERLIRGQEIQNELNSIASSIETKLDIGEVLPDPVEVRPATKHIEFPFLSINTQTATTSSRSFAVSDASWIIPIDVINPDTSLAWFKLSYTIDSLIDINTTGNNAIGSESSVRAYLVNNDTQNIFLTAGTRELYNTVFLAGSFTAGQYDYKHPIISNHFINFAAAGQSNTGYSVALEFVGEQFSRDNNLARVVLLDLKLIYQELINE